MEIICFYPDGADKLGMANDDVHVKTLVLEQDGTEVDSDSFEYIEEGKTFIILASDETWKSCEGLHDMKYPVHKTIRSLWCGFNIVEYSRVIDIYMCTNWKNQLIATLRIIQTNCAMFMPLKDVSLANQASKKVSHLHADYESFKSSCKGMILFCLYCTITVHMFQSCMSYCVTFCIL